jgi:uncharacterized damage-inducible protein DinB
MNTSQLNPSEYHDFYKTYIDMIPDNLELIEGYKRGLKLYEEFFQDLSVDKLYYKYAEGKWTVAEVMQHVIDTERIFMYRCFRFARHDNTPLAGFDQDIYIKPSGANNKTLDSLLEEYLITRQNSIVILKSLSEHDLSFMGNTDGKAMSARAAAFAVLGHELWHLKILKERYI